MLRVSESVYLRVLKEGNLRHTARQSKTAVHDIVPLLQVHIHIQCAILSSIPDVLV